MLEVYVVYTKVSSRNVCSVTYDCANDCTCVVFPKTTQQPEQHHNTNMSCVACVICSVVLGGLCFRRSHGFDDVACVLFLIRYALYCVGLKCYEML